MPRSEYRSISRRARRTSDRASERAAECASHSSHLRSRLLFHDPLPRGDENARARISESFLKRLYPMYIYTSVPFNCTFSRASACLRDRLPFVSDWLTIFDSITRALGISYPSTLQPYRRKDVDARGEERRYM